MSSIIEDLNWRYAVKEFDPTRKVSTDKLNTLLESTRLSASSFGLQPWKFVVVESLELKKELLAASWNQKQVVDASHVIVFCRPENFGERDVDRFVESMAHTRGIEVESLKGYREIMTGFLSRLSEKELEHWMKDQIYIALGTLLTACAVERIDSCPMEGFLAGEYDRILKLEDHGLRSVVVCPIGHRSVDDKYISTQKVRYPLEELVITK